MKNKQRFNKLRLVLGDQLNDRHSWYQELDEQCLYVMAELLQETGYVVHHIQKICGFFLAMEQFADTLTQAGHQVILLNLDQTARFSDLPDLLRHLCQTHSIAHFEYQRPDEYRLLKQLQAFKPGNNIQVTEYDSEHFLVPWEALSKWFPPGKPGRMETFYRKMRRQHNILMAENQPVGGRWNFDADNRHKFKSSDLAHIPEPLVFANPVSEVLKRLSHHKVDTCGKIGETLPWPVNRQQSLHLLNFFCKQCLPFFGHFQDAMTEHSQHQWSLYHSRLSFALNTKMLNPGEVIDQAVQAWENTPDTLSINQVEGFIRQILGWREYIRGVYWSNMPHYETLNHLKARRPLPEWFWSGETKMNCLHQAIDQSLVFAYAHHIQRLMVTGNFCLLAGIDPYQVDQWYLGIYVDAIQWVELPNTRGMSQYADGGMVASKPYAASGLYTQRMSDYCIGCAYNVRKKETSDACPLNSLYWHFMDRHRPMLEKNPRISFTYKNWDKKSNEEKSSLLKRAQWCLNHLEDL